MPKILSRIVDETLGDLAGVTRIEAKLLSMNLAAVAIAAVCAV